MEKRGAGGKGTLARENSSSETMVLSAEGAEEESEAGWVDSAALALRTKRCVLGGMGLKKVMMMGGLDRVRLGVGLGIGGEKERRLQRVKWWLWEQRTVSPPPPPLAKADIAFIFVYNCVSDSQRETVFLFFMKKKKRIEDYSKISLRYSQPPNFWWRVLIFSPPF